MVLVDSQLDHTLGLGMLREGERLQVYCTASVHSDLMTGNPLLRILDSYCGVDWHEIDFSRPFQIPAIANIEFRAVPVTGKAPPYSPHRNDPREDDNIALIVIDRLTARRAFYAPGLAAVDDRIWKWMSSADCLLLDGTFWTADEMIRLGTGRKHAHQMGHLQLSGEGGMLSYLRRLPRTRKILIHLNNTNPILDEDSNERRELDNAGIEVAFDGMEIEL